MRRNEVGGGARHQPRSTNHTRLDPRAKAATAGMAPPKLGAKAQVFTKCAAASTISYVGTIPAPAKAAEPAQARMREVLPSEWMAARNLSTAECLAQASHSSFTPRIIELIDDAEAATKPCQVPMDKPLFQPFPSTIKLQSYKPFQTYDVVINFRNNDKIPRRMKIAPIDNPFFSITGDKCDNLQSGKIAPGMDVSYVLHFTPEEDIDYKYNLVCSTERETFLVPIEAMGARAVLDFPDKIELMDCPVKHDSVHTMFVRNIGNKRGDFKLSVDRPWKFVPASGSLEPGQAMQIEAIYHPTSAGYLQDCCRVQFDTGERLYFWLEARASNVHIRLEKPSLKLDNTFIGLASMKTIKLINRSDLMAKFEWKRFARVQEEKSFRLRRGAELTAKEEKEMEVVRETATDDGSKEVLDFALLAQRYKNELRQMEQDSLLFDDRVFRIEPSQGTIWPNSEIEISVFFEPTTAGVHTSMAYCNVAGRDMRLPLQLKGEGTGPKARFSYDMLDIEEIFIDTQHKYEVVLENRGDIPVTYSLNRPRSLFGPKFKFIPERGTLAVGEQQIIHISFHPDALGQFSEEFVWHLDGAPDPLVFGLKGHVVGPCFHFTVPDVNFEKVSYGFQSVRHINLVNMSQISMSYRLRIPSTDNGMQDEFTVTPAEGTIGSAGTQPLTLKFDPKSVQTYNSSIIVDIDSVGTDLFRLPIYAESVVPAIKLQTSLLAYGDCYLNYLYDRHVVLENTTDFPARYTLQAQEESARAVFQYTSTNREGVLEPHSEVHINVQVQIKRLGEIEFPIFLVISGNEDSPLMMDISANGIGPSVLVSATELDWGKIPVLKQVPLTLLLKNDSPIPAQFECNSVNDPSVFSVEPRSGKIPPNEKAVLTVTAQLDDSLKFTDIVKIATQSGGVHEVNLTAKGSGTTIMFDEALTHVNFQHVFSSRECTRTFTLTNKGRRAQTLMWSLDDKKGSKDTATYVPVFEVIPARFTLKPGTSQEITIRGFSTKAMEVTETLICQGFIGPDPTRRPVLTTAVSANFVTPLMKMNPSSLKFYAAHERDGDFVQLTEKLQLTNTTTLPLHVSFKCPSAYTVKPKVFEEPLEPGETATVEVLYDSSSHKDRISKKEHAKLVISYADHPQKDVVEIYSEVTFPNLGRQTSLIDYGCIAISGERKETFAITNTSTLPVIFNWTFEEFSHVLGSGPAGGGELVLLGQVFDILPMRGTVYPGETENVVATFMGHAAGKFSLVAICDVSGGPKYEVTLRGDVSLIEYALDRTVVDLGTQLYQEVVEQDVILSNTGRVDFDYELKLLADSSLQPKMTISPSKGTIPPRGRQRLTVRCCIAAPQVIDDNFFIQIANFDPVMIRVTGRGTMPRIQLNLPRVTDERYEAHHSEIKSAVVKKTKSAGPTTASTADGKAIDSEAEESAEKRLLHEKMQELLTRLNEEALARLPPQPKGKFIGSPFLFHRTQQAKGSDKKGPLAINESSQVRLSTYLCEFGNVIRNTSKRVVVKIKNIVNHPVHFTLDKTPLIGSGFTVEPDKVRSLPSQETVDLTITFQARNNNVRTEPLEIDLPVKLVGGPTIGIRLRASITVPDMTLSTDGIDFGEVLCGARKTVTIRSQNPNSTACEWSIITGPPAASASKKTTDKKKNHYHKLKEFEFFPSSGTLAPNEKCLMEISFTPSDDKIYDETVSIKINMNSNHVILRVRGRGIQPRIEFEPEQLTLGPVLPAFEGVARRFIAHNPTDYPVEMYSVEFDKQYLEEEAVLRRLDGYTNGVTYIPTRELGAGLPESVIEAAAQKMKLEKIGRDSAPADGPALGVGDLLDPSVPVVPVPSTLYEQPVPTAAEEQAISIILHGPPYSGRRSQARRISKTYSFAYIHIDEAIDAHAKSEQHGAHPDNGLIKILEPGQTHGTAMGVANRGLQSQGQNQADPEESHGHTSTGHAHQDNEQSGHGEYHDAFDSQTSLPEETLIEILKTRTQMEDCVRGIVVDGLESKYGNTTVILRALLRALPEKGRRPLFFNLTADALHIRDREANSQRLRVEKDADLVPVQEVTEQEYDAMSEIEKDKYDKMISKHRRLLKEQLNRKKQERRLWEEELAVRLNERKAEEERTRAKKKGRPQLNTRLPTSEKIEKSAPSPMIRSDMNRLRGSSVSVAPAEILKTGAMSPKLVKRHALDRPEKGSDRARSEAGELMDRERVDDLSSRFTLAAEGGELFQNESTYRRVDNYSSTLEGIVALLREGDKTPANRMQGGAPPADKKAPKGSKINAATADAGSLSVGGTSEVENHVPEEGSNRYLIEINANLDEETVFRAMAEHIPPVKLTEDGGDVNDGIPAPYIEQMIQYPAERPEPPPQLKNFSLSTPVLVHEADDELPTGEGSVPGTAATSAAAGISGVAPTKNESPRRSRIVTKPEDPKGVVEVDDEAERDDTKRSRWIIQPHERKELVVRFASQEVGRFDQTLNFELVGARGRYAVQCVGHCQYTAIVADPKKVFSKCRRTKDDKIIVHGEFIISTGTFDFGPLLNSKPREKYQEKFPENRAQLNIINAGQQEAKITFSLRTDVKGDVYFFEPPAMDLAAGQSDVLSVWAYPKAANHYEDTIVVCVKDNPEPVCWKLSCIGVKPEVEVDKKAISFDKLLLGKTERRELKLKNNNLLPVAWKLAGADLLGDEFQINVVEGILDPAQECVVTADFKANKPAVIKKAIKLEVSDVDKIGGVVQEVPILVTAEAYDIAVDLHFPKGYEGLDFGVIKVYEEGKQICTLRNKGKYEVGYRFVFDTKEQSELFTVSPQQGVIQPSEKPYQVQLVFKSSRELTIKDSIACKCQFFEPATTEVTAVIPVKLSARAVFSKFSILPVRDLNFGALVHGTKATRQFIIENLGEFDFRYSIYKLVAAVMETKAVGKTRANSRASRAGGRTSPPPASKVVNKREIPTKQGDTLNFGAFTVSPTSGFVAAGQKQPIVVEFHSDTPGSFDEIAAVDITDRSLSENPDALEYRLIGESCIPGINTSDFTSIFEEHAVCKRLELFSARTNYYAEDDRVFTFGPYLAGQQAQARFKLTNPSKVSCEVTVSTKPRSKTRGDAVDFAFDSEPKKLSIPSHESRYVTVTFHPTLLQTYAGIFEAVVDNVSEGKSKMLSFELRGEGTLPRIIVERPVMKSSQGIPLLQFRRLMIGATQTLPLVLRNDGIIPAKIKLDWITKDSGDIDCPAVNVTHTFRPQESRTFDIRFFAGSVRKQDAELRVRIIDNAFEDTSVLISGEGYVDDLSFEGLPGDSETEMQLGDCFVNESKLVPFAIKNHCNDFLSIRFEEAQGFSFIPANFHIRPKSTKDITASFLAQTPTEHTGVPIAVKVAKIRYTSQPPDADWDSNMKTIRWVTTDPTQMGAPRKIIDQCPEPTHEVIGTPSADRSLLMKAFADYSTFECDVTDVKFRETLMYQSRVYSMNLRNTGKVRLRYGFGFLEGDEPIHAESEDCPFSISPQSGSIEPGDSANIMLKFTPRDVGHFMVRLVAAVANLPANHKPLDIRVQGTSLRPFCHFEIDDSEYLARRSTEQGIITGVPGALDSTTRVIELSSCGVKIKNTKRFYLMNPTAISYSFEWTYECGDNRTFKCLTPKGTVMSDKKFEMIFEFTPETVDTKEALWKFRVIGHPVSIPFLLVGQASEPNIFMDRPSLNFKSVLVGRSVKEMIKLVNVEAIPFNFTFSETSFEMNHQGQPVLQFHPTSGMVGPNAEFPIEISFCPSAEKMFNFNLLCNVRKKPSPLTINVKGEGYEIHDTLQNELADGSLVEFLPGSGASNTVDFGVVQLNEKRLRRIAIVNSGRFNLDYMWKIVGGKKGTLLAVHPDSGTVKKGEKMFCEVSFLPTQVTDLKDVRAACQILNGSVYHIALHGTGVKPLLRLSKRIHDFGTQFIFRPGMMAASTVLEVTNDDVIDINLEMLPFESMAFIVKRSVSSLSPGETATIEIAFQPREGVAYGEIIKLEINGLSTVDFTVKGQGTDYRVEPLHPEQRTIHFGAASIGHVVQKSIKIINRSAIPAAFTFGPASALESFIAHSVELSPVGVTVLRPKGILNVDLTFRPQNRIPAFAEELFLEAPGYSRPLAQITGACQGIEVKLENDTLPFGAVVIKSSATRRIQLQNCGDIGTTFRWDSAKFAPDFAISPSEGYISPGMEISLEITFHPIEFSADIRYENLHCRVDGIPPLSLTLSGMCVPPPIQNEILKFSAAVRQSDTKTIPVTNKTSTHWHVRPTIDNDFWNGHEVLDIEPGQTKGYDVTFTPLEMIGVGDGGRHEGSVFFPLPDGTGMLYKLYGTADKPLPAGNITRDVPSKTQYTEVLPVVNWLKRPQRLKVTWELAKPDPSVVLKGHEFLDLPALLSKDYKLSFYAYKEGVTTLKVIFKNETTQEFAFYNITFRSTSAGVMATHELMTTVRQSITKEIAVTNPLPVPVTFTIACNSADITIPHTLSVQPRSEVMLPIDFLPVQARETVARLTLQSGELGVYQYDLKLVSNPAGPEHNLQFKVPLGTNQTQTFRFISFAKVKTEYVCKLDSADFSVEKTVMAPAATNSGIEVAVDVTYEPSRLGDTRTQLIVSSATGGDYVCPLSGHCTMPKPQGPISVKAGTPSIVPFRNVFNSSAAFTFSVDNPCFSVKAGETIGAKKSTQISLSYKPFSASADKDDSVGGTRRERGEKRDKSDGGPIARDTGSAHAKVPAGTAAKLGKLSVYNAESGVTWMYYLRCV
ncbi:hypothetical protein PhCBS80983_g05802 [Powellomyces hirtus]|uniref:MSP domain-containing protein n=1 Tax=Powellomyces hirtus TaxID=109895 RepID=A0A507DSK7_9FUNG|nr:hypothetical protein PhCBS80983_g05802 [Powellomyces hirtus]